MLYDMNNEEVLKEMDNIIDPEILYVYSYNYNWSDGFDIPKKIIEKECCDLSTALMIFYGADGYRYLQEKNIQTIIEQIPKNAQTYPIRAKSSSTGAWLAPH